MGKKSRVVEQWERWSSLRHCPAHFGGTMTVVEHLGKSVPWLKRPLSAIESAASAYTDRRTRAFDERYGTDTFSRLELGELKVGPTLETDQFRGWKYGPINEDFFREMMGQCPPDHENWTFLDVGSGKGLAVMLAASYPFRRIIGIDFAEELVTIARKNAAIYGQARGRPLDVEWVCADFMKYALPTEPTVLFLNNPFPPDISMFAVQHIEASLAENPRDAVIAYRRPDYRVKDFLEASPHLKLLRRTPYWMILRSQRP